MFTGTKAGLSIGLPVIVERRQKNRTRQILSIHGIQSGSLELSKRRVDGAKEWDLADKKWMRWKYECSHRKAIRRWR